jgi:hypothetical protein
MHVPAARECLLVRLVSGGKCQGQALVHCTVVLQLQVYALMTPVPGRLLARNVPYYRQLVDNIKGLPVLLLECEQSPHQSTSTCTLARCIKYLYSSSGLVLNLMHMVQYVVYSGVL